MEIDCTNVLFYISNKKSDYYNCLLTEEGREEFDQFVLREECTQNRYNILQQWLDCKDIEPPLELLWKLNEEELLFVTTYFYYHKEYATHLYSNFQKVYSDQTDSEEKHLAASILSNVLTTIINTLLTQQEELQNCCQEVINNVIYEGLRLIDESQLSRCYILDVLNSVYLFESCMQKFGATNLKHLLNFGNNSESLNSVVGTHTRSYTMKYMDDNLKFYLEKVISIVPVEIVLSELNSVAVNPTCNWKYFFSLISVFVTVSPDNAASMKAEVDTWLKNAFEGNNMHLLGAAILTSRHCCCEKVKHFTNYINWFGSLQLKSVSTFTVFLKFLTDIVPYESPLYLKIHISKVSSGPSCCQNIISDYIALAKTRLADLKESTEYLGLFNEFYETDKECQEADIARLIALFNENNEIPKNILEAQIFRRHYYEKIFLKQLLQVSEKENKSRAAVIHKLSSLGKIPSSMYNAWKSL